MLVRSSGEFTPQKPLHSAYKQESTGKIKNVAL